MCFSAAKHDNLQLVEFFISNIKLDPHKLDSSGNSLLFFAVANSNLKMIKYLLSLGINAEQENSVTS